MWLYSSFAFKWKNIIKTKCCKPVLEIFSLLRLLYCSMLTLCSFPIFLRDTGGHAESYFQQVHVVRLHGFPSKKEHCFYGARVGQRLLKHRQLIFQYVLWIPACIMIKEFTTIMFTLWKNENWILCNMGFFNTSYVAVVILHQRLLYKYLFSCSLTALLRFFNIALSSRRTFVHGRTYDDSFTVSPLLIHKSTLPVPAKISSCRHFFQIVPYYSSKMAWYCWYVY